MLTLFSIVVSAVVGYWIGVTRIFFESDKATLESFREKVNSLLKLHTRLSSRHPLMMINDDSEYIRFEQLFDEVFLDFGLFHSNLLSREGNGILISYRLNRKFLTGFGTKLGVRLYDAIPNKHKFEKDCEELIRIINNEIPRLPYRPFRALKLDKIIRRKKSVPSKTE